MKIIYSLLAMLLLQTFAVAKVVPDTIYATTPAKLTHTNLKKSDIIELQVLKVGKLSEDINLSQGEKIKIQIVNYIKPKRGKRNGYYNITYSTKSEVMNGTMRASAPLDKKTMAQKAGVSAAGFVLKVPGLSQAVAATKGVVKPNENQTRMQSVGRNVYETTPLTYVEEGTDFLVEKNGFVKINLKPKK